MIALQWWRIDFIFWDQFPISIFIILCPILKSKIEITRKKENVMRPVVQVLYIVAIFQIFYIDKHWNELLPHFESLSPFGHFLLASLFSQMDLRDPWHFATLNLCSHILAEPSVWWAKISGVNEKIHQQCGKREENSSKW